MNAAELITYSEINFDIAHRLHYSNLVIKKKNLIIT